MEIGEGAHYTGPFHNNACHYLVVIISIYMNKERISLWQIFSIRRLVVVVAVLYSYSILCVTTTQFLTKLSYRVMIVSTQQLKKQSHGHYASCTQCHSIIPLLNCLLSWFDINTKQPHGHNTSCTSQVIYNFIFVIRRETIFN